MGVSECFENKTDTIAVFEALNFQKNKPFKVTFNEGVNVEWKKLEEKTQFTAKDRKQQGDYIDILNKKRKDFVARYGENADEVIAGTAAKLAKRAPD